MRPVLRALCEEILFPSAVFGPVDFAALARFAASRAVTFFWFMSGLLENRFDCTGSMQRGEPEVALGGQALEMVVSRAIRVLDLFCWFVIDSLPNVIDASRGVLGLSCHIAGSE